MLHLSESKCRNLGFCLLRENEDCSFNFTTTNETGWHKKTCSSKRHLNDWSNCNTDACFLIFSWRMRGIHNSQVPFFEDNVSDRQEEFSWEFRLMWLFQMPPSKERPHIPQKQLLERWKQFFLRGADIGFWIPQSIFRSFLDGKISLGDRCKLSETYWWFKGEYVLVWVRILPKILVIQYHWI